jgi:drug/metabolite transporter (DMT)-like permease
MGIGVAYGIWTAVGVALTAVLSKALFGEALTRTMVLGIILIAAGVVLLETAKPDADPSLLVSGNDGSAVNLGDRRYSCRVTTARWRQR